ncbi:MAG TPA: hypothetical protein VJZ00_09165, partial [Thermoanaerobaculia bacterium]|nr:hypothetical protein [Thermoanaerobaculia bacterium]
MRRSLSSLLVLLVCIPLLAQTAPPAAAPATPPSPPPPDVLWQALLIGNKQFVAGKITYDNLKEERKEFADHQSPP